MAPLLAKMKEEVILVQETFLEPKPSTKPKLASTTAFLCRPSSRPEAGPKEDWQSSHGSPCRRSSPIVVYTIPKDDGC
eukprot:2770497-Amphidinium_carterae.1